MNAIEPTLGVQPRRWAGAPSALAALFVLTLRQHTHGKRLLVLAMLYILPCGLAILIRSLSRNVPLEHLEFALILNLLPHALAPFTALLYAGSIIRDEVEEQTLTYLLMRSMPRWTIYAAKMLATMCVTVALVMIATLMCYVAVYWNSVDFVEIMKQRMPRIAGIFALAQVAYCALFGLIGLITRRSLIAGIGYIVAIEGVVANIDFVARSLTVVYYVRSLILRWVELPDKTMREVKEWGMSLDAIPTADTCVWRLLGFSVIATLFAALWFARREFRVKTPGD